MRCLLLLFLVFTGIIKVHSSAVLPPVKTQKMMVKHAIIRLDSSKVQPREFNSQAIEKYAAQKEFIYDDVAPAELSWWDRFWRWIWYVLDRIFGGRQVPNAGFSNMLFLFLKWFLIALITVAISYLIIKIFGLDLRFLISKSKPIEIPYEESFENIHEIDFDDQIESALKNGNYRLAVRMLYLNTLKQLSEKQLIIWKLEKTNQEYVAELPEASFKNEFSKLTNQFEYVWYGEFFIDKEIFEPINHAFSHFNQQMK